MPSDPDCLAYTLDGLASALHAAACGDWAGACLSLFSAACYLRAA